MDGENTHKGNKRVVVKLIEYFLRTIKKPSLFISIFIILELFPSLGLKNDPNLIEDKKSVVNVLFEEEGKELNSDVKEQELSIIGSTGKHVFFYDHVNCSKIVISKNRIISIQAK
ncbi:MAG: hypothetical protein ACYSWS_08835 [Planctomycetota bacterium]|jgi:hypothetical protein